MNRHLVILAGVSKTEDTGIYRRHNFLGVNKAALPFLDSNLLTVALRNYSEAEHKGTGFGPIHILGDPADIQEYVPNNVNVNIVNNVDTTLGDKLRWINSFEEEIVYVTSWDLVPSVDDLNILLADVDSRENLCAYLPLIEGDDLIRNEFRKHRGDKLYPLRKGEDVDFFGASQIYPIRPSRMRLEALANLADDRFRTREYGLRNPAIVWSVMKNLRLGIPDILNLLKTFVGITAKPGPDGQYADTWTRRIPTYAQLAKTFTPLLKKPYRKNPGIDVGMLYAPTLAMDVDTSEEKDILEIYHRTL